MVPGSQFHCSWLYTSFGRRLWRKSNIWKIKYVPRVYMRCFIYSIFLREYMKTSIVCYNFKCPISRNIWLKAWCVRSEASDRVVESHDYRSFDRILTSREPMGATFILDMSGKIKMVYNILHFLSYRLSPTESHQWRKPWYITQREKTGRGTISSWLECDPLWQVRSFLRHSDDQELCGSS